MEWGMFLSRTQRGNVTETLEAISDAAPPSQRPAWLDDKTKSRRRHSDSLLSRFRKPSKFTQAFPSAPPAGGCSSQPLGLQASLVGEAQGISGASRHALAVGFILAMIFIAVQRVLPFCGCARCGIPS